MTKTNTIIIEKNKVVTSNAKGHVKSEPKELSAFAKAVLEYKKQAAALKAKREELKAAREARKVESAKKREARKAESAKKLQERLAKLKARQVKLAEQIAKVEAQIAGKPSAPKAKKVVKPAKSAK